MTSVDVAVADQADDRLHVTIRAGAEAFDVWFRASVPLNAERADALVPLGLLAAMSTRRPLVVHGSVSPRLLDNLDTIQDMLAAFSNGELATTTVTAEPARDQQSSGTAVGSFYSGGVDSLYTAMKHRDLISHLVFIQGFDTFEIGSRRGLAGLEAARRVASDWGKELIEIETNVIEVTEAFVPWRVGHGPALAAIALLLQDQCLRVFVPAGQSYRDLFPLTTHPLLDPRWSTEAMDIVHDGCEFTRVEKVAVIGTSDTALENLRVCNKQFATLNCGVCEKCVRTMVSLRFAGALERCPTFPRSVGLLQVAGVRAIGDQGRANWRQPRETARRQQDWPMFLAVTWAARPRPLLPMRHALGRARRAVGL
jgi:hypothetical protein